MISTSPSSASNQPRTHPASQASHHTRLNHLSPPQPRLTHTQPQRKARLRDRQQQRNMHLRVPQPALSPLSNSKPHQSASNNLPPKQLKRNSVLPHTPRPRLPRNTLLLRRARRNTPLCLSRAVIPVPWDRLSLLRCTSTRTRTFKLECFGFTLRSGVWE